MLEFLTKEIRDGLEAARLRDRRKKSRLRVQVGDAVFPVLRLWEDGLALDASLTVAVFVGPHGLERAKVQPLRGEVGDEVLRTRIGEHAPDLTLDFATLTGAARVALGPDLPVLFCNDESLAANYLAAGQRMRDPLWRLPLWRPYLSYLKSGIADLANAGASRMAGCITAAVYLDRFVPEGQAWTHVDVYSWNDTDRPGKPAGGEAQGLRAAWAMLAARFART